MAEVLGLIASIVNILDGINKTKIFLQENIHTNDSLRIELLPLLGKLTAFKGILQGLQLECELDGSKSGRLHVVSHVVEPLRACKIAVQTITARLERVRSMGKISLAFGRILDKETLAALHILDQTKPVLDLALSADQITILKSIEVYVRCIDTELEGLAQASRRHFERLEALLETRRSTELEDEKQKIKNDTLNWISNLDHSSNLSKALQHVFPEDTGGEWLLQSEGFKDWVQAPGQRTILLTAGAGKTILSSKAISLLMTEDVNGAQSPVVIYYFFDFNDSAKQKVEGMIRSLVYQLVSKADKIPDVVAHEYERQCSERHSAVDSRLARWVVILQELLENAHMPFIFIDALDECDETEQTLLVSTFQKLLGEKDLLVKWLFTCRPTSLFAGIMAVPGCLHISMQAQIIDKDIHRYLSSRLESDPALSSFPQATKGLIARKISARSGGMFRWAECQLNTLQSIKDRRHRSVADVLERMPADIYKTYDRIINSLQLANERVLAGRILSFLSYSMRPVTIVEAAEFAILEDGMIDVDPEDRFQSFEDIILLLGNMVDVQKTLLVLSHRSVQEYLSAGRMNELFGPFDGDTCLFDQNGGADLHIGKRCLQYLNVPQKQIREVYNGTTNKTPNASHLHNLMKSYPLLEYAATKWPYHLRRQSAQLVLSQQIASTLKLTAEPNLWRSWLMLQPADIWENQLALSQILCEASVRGAVIPDWSCNFWKMRQAYRIHSHCCGSDIPPKSGKIVDKLDESADPTDPNLCVGTKSGISKPNEKPKRTYLATLLRDIEPYTSEFDGLVPTEACRFSEGKIVLVEPLGSHDAFWFAKLGSRSCVINSSNIVRQANPKPRVLGLPFYGLAVSLLEIATQAPLLSADFNILKSISEESALRSHLEMFDKTISLASTIMGDSYAAIVRECFSNVTFLPNDAAFEVYLEMQKLAKGDKSSLEHLDISAWTMFNQQDEFINKIYVPLMAMTKSGFRASRQVFSHFHARQISSSIGKDPLSGLRSSMQANDDDQIADGGAIDAGVRRETLPPTSAAVLTDKTLAISQSEVSMKPNIVKAPLKDPTSELSEREETHCPLSLEHEPVRRQRQAFDLEYAGGVSAKNQDKLWMVEFCQQLLDAMAAAVVDDKFKKELNSQEYWFRGLTEAQRTAILYTLSSESTLMQQYFLAQVILQRLENKPLPLNESVQPVTRVNPTSMPTPAYSKAQGKKLKSQYAKPRRNIMASRFSAADACRRPQPAAAVIASRWSAAAGPSFR